MARNILNIDSGLRQINPRSGSSVFVDLSSNQIIGGIKRFLNNLIINSNVNFNTTANIGRIVFHPNELSGYGNKLLSVYTIDENDGAGWTFDADGFLYYGTTLNPFLTTFFPNGDITGAILRGAGVDINLGFIIGGNITAQTSLLSNIINSYTGTTISSSSIWNFNNASNQYGIILDPSTSATYRLQIFGTAGGIKKLYYNTSNEIGVIETVTTIWKINGAGDATFLSLNCATISSPSSSITFSSNLALGNQTLTTTGDISVGLINCSSLSSTGAISGLGITGRTLNLRNLSAITNITLDATTTSGNRLQIYGVANGSKYIYYSVANDLASFDTSLGYNIWILYGGTGNFSTIGSISSNTINANTGTTISSSSIWNFKNASSITNIILDAITTSGNRLQIYGVASGTKYLYYNTSNNIGVFNTSTGTSVWSIDGTTGNILTIGSYSVASLSATSLLCNSISPVSGTVINIGATSEFNFLKSAGVSRVRLYPTSTAGDIMQITRVSDATFTSGYWYFNNTGNFGYNTGGVTVWEHLNNGGLVLNNDLIMNNTGYSIFSNTWYAQSYSTYRNVIRMNQLFTSTSISSMSLSSQYIDFIHPSITPSISSKYMFIQPDSGGNFSQYINNVSGRVLQSDWANLILKTDYNFHSLGAYNQIEHQSTGNLCGLWSSRIGVGGTILNNGNSWSAVLGMECNTNGAIGGGGYNSGSLYRQFIWFIENTTGSGKALGLGCNRTGTLNSTINTATQSTNYALLGYYATNRTGGSYSFTGEHSSMVCDEEYDDLMNYNTDDFIGMVVCSSGKIYNLPYDVDGNTYTKQVDNIKSVDSQPMTRLSKKYKDKSVLGVISHIEKVGKNRNDLNATSWTGCMALDKDERRRIRVASIGEGGIWITNEYGNIENGDYITTSNIAGYSTKQDTDFLMNYTIAKATMDCEFDIEKPDQYKTKYLGDGIYASYIACTYHSG